MKITELFGVTGKVVFITGGASGFGFEAAKTFAENGARAFLTDINGDALEQAAQSLSDAPGKVATQVADVCDKPSLARAVAACIDTFGSIDILFANAGISGGPGFLAMDETRNPDTQIENQSNELWEKVLATNVMGIVKTIQSVVPQMKKQKGGRIIVTSSCSATKTEVFVGSGYVASKATLGHLVRQLAHELAAFNIHVNAIAPGPAATNIAGGRMKDREAAEHFSKYIPLGRVAQPQDIAGALLYFSSSASDYVTGAEILVDGGAVLGPADGTR